MTKYKNLKKINMHDEDMETSKEFIDLFPDHCQWIRDNVPESKFSEVKRFLSTYDNYFDVDQPKMIEHCYRACKNSIKIRYTYEETVDFVRWLIYLLSPDKEFDQKSDVEKDLLQVVGEKSFLYKFFIQTKKEGRVKKKGSYYLFDKVSLTWLGSNVLFFYILTSIAHIIEKSLNNERYKFGGFLDWQEAITSYVLSEFIRTNDKDKI